MPVLVPARMGRVARSPVPIREMGSPGADYSSGFPLSSDLNRDWADIKTRIKKIQEMRRTDAKVKAALLSCKLPIIASKWVVRPPENATKTERLQADFVEENMHGMTYPWVQTLEDITSYLEFGFCVLEKVYRYDQKTGMFYWKKWAPRHQSTIAEFKVASDGGLNSVEQYTWKDGTYSTIPLGIDRLLVFVNEMEGGDWTGNSILRSAYRHYVYKDRLYRIDGMAHERHGVGVPKISTPPGALDAELDVVEQIGENIRSHEKSYVVEPEGYKVEFMGMATQPRNPIESIQHHNEEIAGSVLAGFLNLGFSTSGSRALGQVSTDFFMASLTKHTSYIAGIVNNHAVKQLIDANWGPQKRYPRIASVPIQGIDFQKLAQAVFEFRQGGMLVNDERSIEHFHEILGMPRPDPERIKQLLGEAQQGVQTAGTAQDSSNGNGKRPSDPEDEDEDDSDEDSSEEALAHLPAEVRKAVELQIASLTRLPRRGPMRFQPPLEGTLMRAMTLASDDPDHGRIQGAAREFSRRLASSAERGFLSGGKRGALRMAVTEAEKSSHHLVLAMQSQNGSDREEGA